MSKKSEKIEQLFSKLNGVEQAQLLKKLSSISKSSFSVSSFAQRVQRRFRKSILFSKAQKTGPDHQPLVEIVVYTPFGEFHGVGSNQKIAKLAAVEEAAGNWPD